MELWLYPEIMDGQEWAAQGCLPRAGLVTVANPVLLQLLLVQ